MAEHNDLGQWGEKIAREYLLSEGYAIGGENTRVGNYEIDFIAYKGDRIVFCEVKTRRDDFADPTDAVDPKKMRRLCRAAEEYVQSMNIPHDPQMDVITVIGSPEMDPSQVRIDHIPDAFRPPLRTY